MLLMFLFILSVIGPAGLWGGQTICALTEPAYLGGL